MHDVDVVILGGGGAGIAAAAAAVAAGARALLVSKEPVGGGDTRISEGAAAFPGRLEGDSPELFASDVFRSGDGLSRPDLVLTFAHEGWQAIYDYEAAGAAFKRDPAGSFSAAAAKPVGGHSVRRSLTASGVGVAMGTALRAWAVRTGVPIMEDATAVRVLTEAGEVAGVQVLDLVAGEVLTIPCRAVVVATGCAGWLYDPHTDCVRASSGDGYALALTAGAPLVDMEQVQFLPFACVQPPSLVGVFVGDTSTAGPHGVLRDAQGDVLLEGVNRRTRAEVAKAMALAALAPGRTGPNGGVFLDLRPNLDQADGVAHLEMLGKRTSWGVVRKAYGAEAFAGKAPFEVTPSAHYNMGGVLATADGASSVPGLYAAGATMGGLHGGNRLGTTALAEILVFGRRAGTAAAHWAAERRQVRVAAGLAGAPPLPTAAAAWAAEYEGLIGRSGDARPSDVMRELQRTMWDLVGVTRIEKGLESALAAIDRLAAASLQVSGSRRYNTEWRDAIQVGLMLTTARVIATSALARRESRGAHVRLDYPGKETEPRHVLVRLRNEAVEVEWAPVPPPPVLSGP